MVDVVWVVGVVEVVRVVEKVCNIMTSDFFTMHHCLICFY